MNQTMRHLCALALLAALLAPSARAGELPRERLPHPDHVVVVIEENRGYSQIMNMRIFL